MQLMGANWYDACSALVAFSRHSADKNPESVQHLQHVMVRLFSMMHAFAVAELERTDFEADDLDTFLKHNTYDLVDPKALDEESWRILLASDSKVELLFQWIQGTIVEYAKDGLLTIPPPILSRAFQEMGNGMLAYHDAIRIAYIPMPVPYTQACDALLIIHLFFTPWVICQWVEWVSWAGAFSFLQVFVLWAMHFIALQLENPYGPDSTDINGHQILRHMNKHLRMLVSPAASHTPTLCPDAAANLRKRPCSVSSEADELSKPSMAQIAVKIENVRALGESPAANRRLQLRVGEIQEPLEGAQVLQSHHWPPSGAAPGAQAPEVMVIRSKELTAPISAPDISQTAVGAFDRPVDAVPAGDQSRPELVIPQKKTFNSQGKGDKLPKAPMVAGLGLGVRTDGTADR